MVPPIEDTTVQKYDMQFGTNVLGTWIVCSPRSVLTDYRFVGHWLFTTLLLPALFAATDASPTHEKARVVTVSSSANYLTKGLDFEALEDGPQRRKYAIWELYNKSKFVGGLDLDLRSRRLTDWTTLQGNVVVAKELARRYGDKIVSMSLNPGNISSDLQRHLPSFQNYMLVWFSSLRFG
jgi:NAD(P)-dependent dehydrogenase (short-subunit alcohol dehydrogenase family)